VKRLLRELSQLLKVNLELEPLVLHLLLAFRGKKPASQIKIVQDYGHYVLPTVKPLPRELGLQLYNNKETGKLVPLLKHVL
jgi:hypothetical protein